MPEGNVSPGAGKFADVRCGDLVIRTHYYEVGAGSSYVLLLQTGGAGTSAYMCWYLNLAAFAAAGYHVLAPDAPNFGLTEQVSGPDGVVSAPEFTVAFMDAIGIGAAHVIGNSMGSMTSTRVAIDHPQRVRSLVFTGGEPRVDTEESRAIAPTLGRTARMDFVREMLSQPQVSASDMRKATADFFYDPDHPRIDEVASMRLQDLRRPGVQERERAAAFRQIQGGRVNITSADLAMIQAPTCLIHGRDERFFFSEEVAPILIAAAVKTCFVIPNASCTVLSQCGHWPQIERADTFNVLALEFLRSVDGA